MGMNRPHFNTSDARLTDTDERWRKLEPGGKNNLSPTTLRIIGILFLVAAAVVAVLNLKRVANLGMVWLSPPLLILGLALVAVAARRR